MKAMEQKFDQNTTAKCGAPDSGKYFRYMPEFVGFTAEDEQAIVQTKAILEKQQFPSNYIPRPPCKKRKSSPSRVRTIFRKASVKL
ncbi:MAG: hypothetical protein HY741_01140 [Chloroflexi bacterium]|nr:hypothetical protein [Chloroflexota bacterium]